MAVDFKCPKCDRRYRVASELAGKTARCKCGHVMRVPDSSGAGEPDTGPPGEVAPECSPQDITPRQIARFERSKAILGKRGVPMYPGPLFVEDDLEVQLRTADEVARRVFVPWAVSLRGEGEPLEDAWGIIDTSRARVSVSPEERRCLKQKHPDPNEAQEAVWRLEAMWVLIWALGHLEEFTWPEGMCDVRRLVSVVAPNLGNRALVSEATLRDKAEILDAQDLTMRIHWALRQAWLGGEPIPENLDWKRPTKMVPPAPTAAGAVVEQRHYVLNWLVRFGDADWDDVDTPT